MKTLEKIRFLEAIAKVLPHGSGINSDWEIKVYKDHITCKNCFDHMDENGFYDGGWYIDYKAPKFFKFTKAKQ